MHVDRVAIIDTDNGDPYAEARMMGEQVWQDMQIPVIGRQPFIDTRTSQDIIRDLRAEYGSNAAIAAAIAPDAAPGTKEHDKVMRNLQRHLKGDRRIGPEYRALYAAAAPPRTFAARALGGTRPPREGVLTLQYSGMVVISNDSRPRTLPPKSFDEPPSWVSVLGNPWGIYRATWGGGVPFGGEGELAIVFDSPEGE